MMTITSIIHEASVASIQVTFLVQYRRTFDLPNFQRLCKILIIFSTAYGIVHTAAACLWCVPLEAYWNPSVVGTCINHLAWWYVNETICIVMNVIIFVLPLPVLHNLALDWRRKIILCGIFALGFLYAHMTQLEETLRANTSPSTCSISVNNIATLGPSTVMKDIPWNTVQAEIWAVIQLACAM